MEAVSRELKDLGLLVVPKKPGETTSCNLGKRPQATTPMGLVVQPRELHGA
jgi:hypothetical protein